MEHGLNKVKYIMLIVEVIMTLSKDMDQSLWGESEGNYMAFPFI